MRDVLPVLRVLGMLLLLFALSMLVPWATSYYQRDGVTLVWPMAMGLTALLGVALWWGLFPFKQDLQPRHGVILVTVAWVSLPLCGALPIWGVMFVQGAPISVTHAYFEAVSGLTTTGATVLSGLDALPVSLNMWRTFLQWMGGMGILILAVALLPLLGVGGSQLFRAEAACRSKTPSSPRAWRARPRGCGACTACFRLPARWRFGWVGWPRWMR